MCALFVSSSRMNWKYLRAGKIVVKCSAKLYIYEIYFHLRRWKILKLTWQCEFLKDLEQVVGIEVWSLKELKVEGGEKWGIFHHWFHQNMIYILILLVLVWNSWLVLDEEKRFGKNSPVEIKLFRNPAKI